MPDFNELRKMPADRLLTYYNALTAICNKHAKDRDVYFNPNTETDRARWAMFNTQLMEMKPYLDMVFNALKDRVVNDLDNYKGFDPGVEDMQSPAAKKPVAKKPVETRRGRPKKADKK